jgi:hypothetical protein
VKKQNKEESKALNALNRVFEGCCFRLWPHVNLSRMKTALPALQLTGEEANLGASQKPEARSQEARSQEARSQGPEPSQGQSSFPTRQTNAYAIDRSIDRSHGHICTRSLNILLLADWHFARAKSPDPFPKGQQWRHSPQRDEATHFYANYA